MRRGVLQIGDILVVKDGATTGKVAYISKNFPFELACINEHVFICRPVTLVSDKYLFQYLRSHEGHEQIMSTFHGGAQGGINSEFVDSVKLPLPPLNEQKRIVEKLDAILPKVKNAKARLEKIPLILKKFRQSVLSAACSGRLKEDWRGSEEYDKDDYPASWQKRFLPDVLDSKPKNGYSGKPVKYETNTRVLSLTATTSGYFKSNCYKFLDETIPGNSQAWLRKNDIVIQRGNALEYVGVPAIYKGEDGQFIYPDLMIRLSADRNTISHDYLYLFLSCEKTRTYMRDHASGTAGSMPKINQGVLQGLTVYLPSLEEQQEIVRQVEKLFALADSLEAKYKKAIQRVVKIEQSVLAKAFRGELADPDPNDEPAAELLNRILQEKAKLETTKKPRSNRSGKTAIVVA